MQNLTSFLRYHAIQRPADEAMLYRDRRVGYAELLDRAERLAGWLRGRDIGPGDVVALVMKNSAAFLEASFAASHLGAVLLPINYRLAAAEIAYIHGHAGVKLLLADSEFSDLVEGLADVVLMDEEVQRDSLVLSAGAEPVREPVRRQGSDLYRLMYTSGTTDRPKGVTHSYDNLYWKNIDHVMALGLTRANRLLMCGPMYHVGAMDLPGMAVLWMGGTVKVLRDFTPEEALGAIEAERLTCTWFAPVMLNLSLGYPKRDRFDVSSLEWCIGGGERTPESRIRQFTDLFTGARYIDGYGLTETVSGDTLMEPGREIEKIGSTGRALAHVEIEIRDDDGTPLPAGTEGEICLRGAKVTRGYWRDEERTAAAFHVDGWFRSGDVGYLDADGFLFLTDRKKDMIISGGENIASSEVERVIYEMEEIAEAAVVGQSDPRWGEVPAAVVVLKDGASLDLDRLTAHCRTHLAGFKVPKHLHLKEALPRNPSGKVLKRVLRDQLEESR